MDSAALLDILGNENRRRILRLLSQKPCYVTEISEYLGVSPKAVIDHLRRLEQAGLVESRTDDQRRKYFHISRNLRLEVSVSPYGFGMKSAYPASKSLDITTCRHLSVSSRCARNGDTEGLSELARELHRLEELEGELSLAQRWVHGRIAEIMEQIGDEVGEESERRMLAAILAALAGGAETVADVSKDVEVPPPVVEDRLTTLAEQGIVHERNGVWKLSD